MAIINSRIESPWNGKIMSIGDYNIDFRVSFAKGSFSNIYHGYYKYNKRHVAIKHIKSEFSRTQEKRVKTEIEIHRKLKHSNIVQLLDVISDDLRGILLVLEYCEGGNFAEFQNKRPITEPFAQHYMSQVKDALHYLNRSNIVHRDLKPQNILMVNKYHIKITDFGLSRIFCNLDGNDLLTSYCGSPLYMSPELLTTTTYNEKTDIWSLGIILYEILTGVSPFSHIPNIKSLRQVISRPINLDIPILRENNISRACLDILKKLLEPELERRINWQDVFDHVWFKSNILITRENDIISDPLNGDLLKNAPRIFYNEVLSSSGSLDSEEHLLDGINVGIENNEELFYSASDGDTDSVSSSTASVSKLATSLKSITSPLFIENKIPKLSSLYAASAASAVASAASAVASAASAVASSSQSPQSPHSGTASYDAFINLKARKSINNSSPSQLATIFKTSVEYISGSKLN